MFNNDLSYLYSDEYLTSSFSNEKELPKQVSNSPKYPPVRTHIYRKITPASSIRRRSKHIMLFPEQALKCFKRREKNQLAARRLKEKRQLFKENLHQKIKQLTNEQLYLENQLKQRQVYKRDLETEINNTFCMNSLTEVLSTDKEKMPLSFDQYSNDLQLFNMSTTNILNLNNDMDVNQE